MCFSVCVSNSIEKPLKEKEKQSLCHFEERVSLFAFIVAANVLDWVPSVLLYFLFLFSHFSSFESSLCPFVNLFHRHRPHPTPNMEYFAFPAPHLFPSHNLTAKVRPLEEDTSFFHFTLDAKVRRRPRLDCPVQASLPLQQPSSGTSAPPSWAAQQCLLRPHFRGQWPPSAGPTQ